MTLPPVYERRDWVSAAEEPGHPLAALEGVEVTGAPLRVRLGPRSRFGARYFVLLRGDDAQPALVGLHHSGPYPSYNWVEVSATDARLDRDAVERLFALLFGILPPGGHLMVEYDSPQRAETADALAHGVPAVATPLGALLLGIGFGAHFKDWQIAEGGSEGPRKLQAYKSPAEEHTRRWRSEAVADLRRFVEGERPGSGVVRAARDRARALLDALGGS